MVMDLTPHLRAVAEDLRANRLSRAAPASRESIRQDIERQQPWLPKFTAEQIDAMVDHIVALGI